MLRHLIIAAWRNMAASKLLSAISILGLSVGIAAVILMGSAIRNQINFDAYLPLKERTYLAVSPPHPIFREFTWNSDSDFRTVDVLRGITGVESVARLALNKAPLPIKSKQGDITGFDPLYWADPNIFDVLRLPVLYGDLNYALTRPDGVVLPQAMAEKYFGQDNVVGRMLTIDGHPMVVRAVIRDLPANGTGLQSGIFVSGIAPFSALMPPGATWQEVQAELHDSNREKIWGELNWWLYNRTYVRLKPNADIAKIESMVAAYYKPTLRTTEMPLVKLVALAGVNVFEPLNPGIRVRLVSAGAAGLLVLFIAAINFVNLMVARSARREREVGIRKALGAGRGALLLQFLGEAMLAVVLGTCIAIALSEWLLPAMNALLGTGAQLGIASDRDLPLALFFGVVVLGLAAGAYPAFLLSSFKPAVVLKGWVRSASQGQVIRNILVALQFAVLVVLAISAWVIWRQREYATHEALRIDSDQMLIIPLLTDSQFAVRPGAAITCSPVLETELRKLPGIRGVECSGAPFLDDPYRAFANGFFLIRVVQASPGLLQLYGVKPIAGSLEDGSGTIINMAAVRKLGFASPQAAIGRSWIPSIITGAPRAAMLRDQGQHIIITAVVPDFALQSVTEPIEATLYSQWSTGAPSFPGGGRLHVKLNGHQIPETLAAIDRLWAATGQKGPPDHFFLDDHMQQQYLGITREAQLFAIFAGVAVFLACLGLVGIAVSTAERRTKEIGIRKSMGAATTEIVVLLLWQFSQPVFWANVIAWPVSWWLMRRWLSGFAYHVDLHWWVFAAASAGALMIALITVAGQAFLTARQKPVLALRYE